ncbi:hypothetical protein [Kitasatospora sp. NPDC002040]|uniref:hypothetical protein n=1 Tax=Kitasatospora sp. NPDC002040 TaxID=3154661 RepID=UPI00331E7454
MSGALQLPSLAGEFADLRRRLDALERNPGAGARDEPLPMSPYTPWSGGAAFRAVAQIGVGGLNRPVVRLDFWATVTGAGSVEFRLFDVDSGRTTSAVIALGAGTGQWVRAEWLHTLDPPHTRTGTWRRVLLQARQSVGTPTLTLGLGLASGVSTTTAPGATTAGTWSTVTAPAGY